MHLFRLLDRFTVEWIANPDPREGGSMRTIDTYGLTFDPGVFLAYPGFGRKIIELEQHESFFSQGDPADSVFYLQSGRAKLTVVSHEGKEATITLLSGGDF